MVEEKNKSRLLSQILAAVVVALLAGSTAPWWWNELKNIFQTVAEDKPSSSVETPPVEPTRGETLRSSLEDYETVQALYSQAKSAHTCVEFRRIVEQIRLYTNNNRVVPESFRYTVIYPATKSMPTISDLATDRIVRLKKLNSQCFEELHNFRD